MYRILPGRVGADQLQIMPAESWATGQCYDIQHGFRQPVRLQALLYARPVLRPVHESVQSVWSQLLPALIWSVRMPSLPAANDDPLRELDVDRQLLPGL